MRSLFLGAGMDAETAGLWFVALDQRPDAAEAALHCHLRMLTMARVPAWAAAGKIVPPDGEPDAWFEAVLFRHWDPDVLVV